MRHRIQVNRHGFRRHWNRLSCAKRDGLCQLLRNCCRSYYLRARSHQRCAILGIKKFEPPSEIPSRVGVIHQLEIHVDINTLLELCTQAFDGQGGERASTVPGLQAHCNPWAVDASRQPVLFSSALCSHAPNTRMQLVCAGFLSCGVIFMAPGMLFFLQSLLCASFMPYRPARPPVNV